MRSNFIYKHFSPKEFNEQKPAIFLFHGYGSDEEDLLPLVEDLAETHHIFSLRGSITLPSGFAYWYIEEDDTNSTAEFNDAIQSVQNFIKQTIKEYNLDSQNVVLLGFSQGAMLVQSIALVMGKDINKVVALSGCIPNVFKERGYAKKSVKHLKIFISHGIDDTVVPFQWGEASRDYFKALGANVSFKSYVSGHYVSMENKNDLVEFIKEE